MYLFQCLFTSSPDSWGAGETCAFSCSCWAWIGNLCWYLQSRGVRGSRTQPHRVLLMRPFWPGGSTGCWDSAHFLHVVWLNGPVVLLLPASGAFQGILRKKNRKKKFQNCSRWLAACKIQTPKARLKALARLNAINSKMLALFLLDRFVTFPFLSLLDITCSTGIAYCRKNSYLQQRGSCLKWPEVMPGLLLCLHCPQYGIGAGGMSEWVWRHHSGAWLHGSFTSCSHFSSSLEELHQSKVLSPITGIKSYSIPQILQCEYNFVFSEMMRCCDYPRYSQTLRPWLNQWHSLQL